MINNHSPPPGQSSRTAGTNHSQSHLFTHWANQHSTSYTHTHTRTLTQQSVKSVGLALFPINHKAMGENIVTKQSTESSPTDFSAFTFATADTAHHIEQDGTRKKPFGPVTSGQLCAKNDYAGNYCDHPASADDGRRDQIFRLTISFLADSSFFVFLLAPAVVLCWFNFFSLCGSHFE